MHNHKILDFYPNRKIPIFLLTDEAYYIGDTLAESHYHISISSHEHVLFQYLSEQYAQVKLSNTKIPVVLLAMRDPTKAMEVTSGLRKDEDYGEHQPICYYRNGYSKKEGNSVLLNGTDLVIDSPFSERIFTAQLNALLRRVLTLDLKVEPET